jgi:predicted HicB family RNase H-like nuclease
MTVQTDNEEASKTTVKIQVPIPIDLHRRLRIQAIENGLSLKDAVIVAIESWVGAEQLAS